MKDYMSNDAEVTIKDFIKKLETENKIGPAPISGYDYSGLSVENLIGCTAEIAEKMFTEPSIFQFDDQDQVYIEVEDLDAEGNTRKSKLYLDSDTKSPEYTSMCQDLIEQLPTVTFDLECGGYPTRQAEAAALYKVAVLNSLYENEYHDEINNILLTYDFKRMSSSKGGTPFIDLLNEIQELSDPIAKMVMTCCTTKLVSERIKKDTSYKGWLNQEDSERLRQVAERESTINYKYNEKFCYSTSVKDKILIGEQYALERQELINSLDEDLTVLFSIYKLDLNAVPLRAKSKIRREAARYIDELLKEDKIENDIDVIKDFKNKLVRRAQKNYLMKMKIIRYKMWNKGLRDNILPKY